MPALNNDISLSIVMPCLNEEKTIGICVDKALDSIKRMGIKGEVVVSDNGSTDNSVHIAQSHGARVVHQPLKGYGYSLMKGITEAAGKYVIMGDADDSYDFSDIEGFVRKLNEGYDLVMGSRLKGSIKPEAMSLSHRLGNPVMTLILNVMYRTGISDVNCGMRGFTKEAFNKLDLKCGGMEFASEFVVKATKEKIKITEIPITLYPDGRDRPPHLRTIHDGWRHLRFLLIYCPMFLYFVPGLTMITLGSTVLILGMFSSFKIGAMVFDFHVNFFASVFVISGFQLCMIGLFARSFAYINGFDKYDQSIKKFIERFSLERNLAISLALIGLGAFSFLLILIKWLFSGMGALFEVREAILGLTLLTVGFQLVSSSFFLSMLLMEHPRNADNKQID